MHAPADKRPERILAIPRKNARQRQSARHTLLGSHRWSWIEERKSRYGCR
jgi:hypothetical protein